MLLGQSQQYKSALEALGRIQDAYGNTPELRAIAQYLLYSNTVELSPPTFPWVGVNDPRDQQGIAVWNQAWRDFLEGEDDEN